MNNNDFAKVFSYVVKRGITIYPVPVSAYAYKVCINNKGKEKFSKQLFPITKKVKNHVVTDMAVYKEIEKNYYQIFKQLTYEPKNKAPHLVSAI